MSTNSSIHTNQLTQLKLDKLIQKINNHFGVKAELEITERGTIILGIESLNVYIGGMINYKTSPYTLGQNLDGKTSQAHILGEGNHTWFYSRTDKKSIKVMTFIVETLGGYFDFDGCDDKPYVFYPFKELFLVDISLKKFVKQYKNSKEFKKDLSDINNHTDSCSVSDFFDKYQEIITGNADVHYKYHHEEDSYTTANFSYQVSNNNVNIEFNLFVDLDMRTADEVYNCILSNYIKMLEIKKELTKTKEVIPQGLITLLVEYQNDEKKVFTCRDRQDVANKMNEVSDKGYTIKDVPVGFDSHTRVFDDKNNICFSLFQN